MPSKPKKPCAYRGCPNLTYDKYCDDHKKHGIEEKREQYKRYETDKRDKDSFEFYSSTAWQKVRTLYRKAHPLCEMCLKNGYMVPARLVDHIIPIRMGGARLDENNLQSLCFSCHEKKSHEEGSR